MSFMIDSYKIADFFSVVMVTVKRIPDCNQLLLSLNVL